MPISLDSADMYATKRRRRNVKTSSKCPLKDPPKSNPSKRHRERLNSELELLASLLPFEQAVISKLDKLSILRLAVSYLRTKSYFQAALSERYPGSSDNQLHRRLQHRIHHGQHCLPPDIGFTDSSTILQALSGFLFVVTCDGEVFYASSTVEQYLGFHQSDIIHQSALELIHSEDRDQFKAQLNWRSQLSSEFSDISPEQALMPENVQLMQRCFTVRFRCLLDNASGFITLEISGKLGLLIGQNVKVKDSPIALFALCCPFGPLPLADVPPRDYTFKSKHKMDMSPISMDQRGRMVFEYSDEELMNKGGYDLIHPDDLSYYSAAHQEIIKTGSSGLIAYRLLTKDLRWVWLQTSLRVIYKNSKPEFILCTHRHLTEDEGRDLFRKRGSEFKLPYPIMDCDLSDFSTPIGEEEVLSSTRPVRSYTKKSKTQLRDYLQTGRKRKAPLRHDPYGDGGSIPMQADIYSIQNSYAAALTDRDLHSDSVYASYLSASPLAMTFDQSLYHHSGYQALCSTLPASDRALDTAAVVAAAYQSDYIDRAYSKYYTSQYYSNYYNAKDSPYHKTSGSYYYDLISNQGKYKYDINSTPAPYQHLSRSPYGLDLTSYKSSYDTLGSREGQADLFKYEGYSSLGDDGYKSDCATCHVTDTSALLASASAAVCQTVYDTAGRYNHDTDLYTETRSSCEKSKYQISDNSLSLSSTSSSSAYSSSQYDSSIVRDRRSQDLHKDHASQYTEGGMGVVRYTGSSPGAYTGLRDCYDLDNKLSDQMTYSSCMVNNQSSLAESYKSYNQLMTVHGYQNSDYNSCSKHSTDDHRRTESADINQSGQGLLMVANHKAADETCRDTIGGASSLNQISQVRTGQAGGLGEGSGQSRLDQNGEGGDKMYERKENIENRVSGVATSVIQIHRRARRRPAEPDDALRSAHDSDRERALASADIGLIDSSVTSDNLKWTNQNVKNSVIQSVDSSLNGYATPHSYQVLPHSVTDYYQAKATEYMNLNKYACYNETWSG